MNVKQQFMDGMFFQNPVTVQLLGKIGRAHV